MTNDKLIELAKKYPPPSEWFDEVCQEIEHTPAIKGDGHNVEPKDS